MKNKKYIIKIDIKDKRADSNSFDDVYLWQLPDGMIVPCFNEKIYGTLLEVDAHVLSFDAYDDAKEAAEEFLGQLEEGMEIDAEVVIAPDGLYGELN